MTTEFNMNDFAGFEQAIFQKGLINTKKMQVQSENLPAKMSYGT